jgi:hypothetical protein
MPQLKIRDVRLPELHLREMSRDDIIKGLSEAIPDVDLAKMDPTKLDLSKVQLPKLDVSKVDLSKVDLPARIGAAADAAAVAVRLKKPDRGSRLRRIVGGVVIAWLVSVAILSLPPVRARLAQAIDRLRGRERWSYEGSGVEDMTDTAVYASAVAIPIESDPYATGLPTNGGTTPDPLGTTELPLDSIDRVAGMDTAGSSDVFGSEAVGSTETAGATGTTGTTATDFTSTREPFATTAGDEERAES